MIAFYYISSDNGITQVPIAKDANWIHVEAPTSHDIASLSSEYDFPHDYLSAVLDNQEISRQEGLQQTEVEQPVLLLLQYPKETLSPSKFKQVEALPFSIIITPKVIITACNDKLDLLDNLKKSKASSPQIPPKERLAIQLAWYFSDLFNHHLKVIKVETDELESELQMSIENKQLFELINMQKSLVYFTSALNQNLIVIEKFRHSNLLMTDEQSLDSLYDIIIETRQALASAKIQSELLSQLGSLFSAVVSNNMNIVMKILTVITIILTIPTIVGGIYGMNVQLPFAEEQHAFWWILLATFLFSLITIWILRKKKYF